MRSKSSRVESTSSGGLGVPPPAHDISQEEDQSLPIKNLKVKVLSMNDEGEEKVTSKKESSQQESSESAVQGPGIMDLSKEDLLKLLGVMEGEVQAREDVIRVLKSGLTRPEVLECHYGTTAQSPALQALHRDGLLTPMSPHNHNNVFQRPMTELDRLQKKHKDTYRRMLEQLLLAEKCHRRTVQELDSEKQKHADYMNKSDDFTNLLEQERERLKRLLENERAYQVRKEKEHTTRLAKVREELVKLKSFALMLVDERQLHLEKMDQQSQRVQDLSQQLQEREQALTNASGQALEDSQRAQSLEVQLKEKSVKLAQQHEEMAAKLADKESQNRQLDAKLSCLGQKVKDLEESNNALRRSEEELHILRDKISNRECGNSNLITELENLRKRVLEMKGKDEEITKTETQCKELRRRLQEEESQSKELKIEVAKLQTRMTELKNLESIFSLDKAECTQLHSVLEKERGLSKELTDELVSLKIRMKELESSELRLEKAELTLKDDLSKLKSLTVVMVEERKSLMERVLLDDKKRDELSIMIKAEQGKVMDVTERLIEESKRLLKLKSEMEVKVGTLTREKGELRTKLEHEMERNKELSFKVSQMNKKMDGLEETVEKSPRNLKKEIGFVSDTAGKEDNRVKELTFEIERLKNRLKQLEVVEGDLIKTEDQYDLLEKKFMTEQDKANILFQQVEEMRSQIARNKAIEKGEAESQERGLHQCCEMEEAKTRDLQADVVALKEKIHELMNKEDQLSQLQVDYTVLQQKFLEEEERKKNMSIEVHNLTKELEVTKRHSRSLRPSLNGRRIVDAAMTSTGVQTDPLVNETAEEDTPAVFIRKSVQEENHIMNNLRQKGLKKPSEKTGGYPSAAADLSMKKSWIPWMRKKENGPQGSSLEKSLHLNGDSLSSELTLSQKQGQPLHIRVTPDHQNSTATLEISSTTADEFYSGSSLSPTTLCHPKSRITIIPSHTSNPKGRSPAGPRCPERAKSPVTITTISRAKSPESRKASTPSTSSTSSGRSMSPIATMTVSTSVMSRTSVSPEPQEMTMGRAVFKVTPEKQMVPTPIRKCNFNTNIITTTEDNKIHIHLGSPFKGSSETNNPTSSKMVLRPVTTAMESKELTLSTGTVLRSPRQTVTAAKSMQSKVMSSITITPVTSTTARTSQVLPGQDAHPTRAGLTRIPMSKSLKTGKAMLGAMGIPSGARLESRAESVQEDRTQEIHSQQQCLPKWRKGLKDQE